MRRCRITPEQVEADGAAPVGKFDRPLTTRRVRVDDLHEDPANANQHDEINIRTIRDSLKEFGQVEPLIVQAGTGKVIGGNGRLRVLRDLGVTEVDVVEYEADNVRAAALGIALNRTAKTSTFDDVALARTLEAIRSEDFPIEATGFTDPEVDGLLARLAAEAALPPDADGKEYDESVADEVEFLECPSCGHRWPK